LKGIEVAIVQYHLLAIVEIALLPPMKRRKMMDEQMITEMYAVTASLRLPPPPVQLPPATPVVALTLHDMILIPPRCGDRVGKIAHPTIVGKCLLPSGTYTII
jgi:hypothetical protein